MCLRISHLVVFTSYNLTTQQTVWNNKIFPNYTPGDRDNWVHSCLMLLLPIHYYWFELYQTPPNVIFFSFAKKSCVFQSDINNYNRFFSILHDCEFTDDANRQTVCQKNILIHFFLWKYRLKIEIVKSASVITVTRGVRTIY